MKKLYKIITIIIVTIIISNLYYFNVLINREKEKSNGINLEKITDNLREGDIILFAKRRLKTIKDIIPRTLGCILTNTPYYHIGVVIDNGKNKYILAAVPENYHFKTSHKSYNLLKCNKSIRIKEIYEYLNYYKNKFNPIVKIYRKPEWEHKYTEIIKAAKSMCLHKYEINIKDIIFSNEKHKKNDKKIMNCITFLGHLLEELNEFETINYPYKNYIPGKIEKYLKLQNFINTGVYEIK